MATLYYIFHRWISACYVFMAGPTLAQLSSTSGWFKHSSKIFLLTVPRRYFFCESFMSFLSCVCYDYVCVCLLMPCGHLLGRGWPLGSLLWYLSLLHSHWYPMWSDVVLDWINSLSLPSFLLSLAVSLFHHNMLIDLIGSLRWFCCCWSMVYCCHHCFFRCFVFGPCFIGPY